MLTIYKVHPKNIKKYKSCQDKTMHDKVWEKDTFAKIFQYSLNPTILSMGFLIFSGISVLAG